MSTFNEREAAFEGKFAQDEALEFKATARRNRLLATWAGELMGLEGDHLADYVAVITKLELTPGGDAAVLRKIAGDLAAAGLKVSEDQVRGKMDELQAVARGQLIAEG